MVVNPENHVEVHTRQISAKYSKKYRLYNFRSTAMEPTYYVMKPMKLGVSKNKSFFMSPPILITVITGSLT